MKLNYSVIFIVFSLFIFTIFINIVNGLGLNEDYSWESNLTNVRWSNLALGDINNDGNIDLVLFGCLSDGANNCENGLIAKIYINNGTTFTENQTWQQNLTAVSWGSISFGDINNDGKLDLIVTGCGSSKYPPCDNLVGSKIYINNGTTFTENQTWQQNLTAVSWGSISFGDINNDGKLDLIVTGISSTEYISKIYINNGTTFTENQTWQQNLKKLGRSSVTFVDINNDGNLDLDLNGYDNTNENAKIYINNGTTFTENQTWQQNLSGWGFPEIAYGDFDNDGKIDCIRSGVMTGDHLYIYKNNEDTFVLNQSSIAFGGDYLVGFFDGSLAWGDIDNDGDLDLAAMGADGEGGRSRIYKNNYNTFIEYTEAMRDFKIGFRQGSLAWGDIDNDGDLDLMISGVIFPSGDILSKIYTNNGTTSNTIPTYPILGFASTFNFSTGKLTLSWGNGSDAETLTSGLYYNIRVGTCPECHDVVSGVYGGSSNPTAGYFGNMMQRKRIVLNRPDLENRTIYWAMQTIDTGLAKSTWSTEQVFEIKQTCIENWTYSEWTACLGGQQMRTTTDLNNCGTTLNRSETSRSCSTGSSGPNGPSGSIAVPPEEKPKILENITWYFERIQPGVDTGFIMNETGLSVNQVWIKVKSEVENVAMSIKKLLGKPQIVSKEPEGRVYQYLNISHTNLTDADIEIGKIMFRIENLWIESNKINKSAVVLKRYSNDEWQKLKTEFRNEDSEFAYYLAETPRFSIFAITGETEKETICKSKELRCNDSKIEECSEDGTAWTEKEICTYGCGNVACNERPIENTAGFPYFWPVLITILIIIIGIVVGIKLLITPRTSLT